MPEALPMVVGMRHETANETLMMSEAAMSPKKTKTENDTIAPTTLGKNVEFTSATSDVGSSTVSSGTSDTDIASTDLDSAASEWAADPIAVGHEEESETPSISLLTDPSGMGSTLSKTMDIAAAQNSDEELVLDADLDGTESEEVTESEETEESDEIEELAPLELANDAEIDDTLARLQAKVEAQDAEAAKESAELEEARAIEAKELLAKQIAEDVALERAVKEEAENDLANDPELRAALPREPEETESGELDLREMESCIEALLFMSERPLSANKLRDLLGPEMSLHYFQEALTNLQARYARFSHGIELAEIAHGYQFRTKPVRAALAKKLAKIQTQRLSTGAMESLAIIAYKQPVMKDDIDKIRGVDSSHFIRGLLDKKLIKIAGRSELPGRPMVYATSNEFLEIFSLKSLDSLPPLKELESMIPGSQSGNPDDGDPRVKKMRELVSQMNSDKSVSLMYDPKEDEKFLTEIRERVKSIEINPPTLVAEKERQKAIAEGRMDPQAESFAAAVEETDLGDTAEMPIE
jgi:segregation and condensation protein B